MNFEMIKNMKFGFTSSVIIDLTLSEYCVKFKQNILHSWWIGFKKKVL